MEKGILEQFKATPEDYLIRSFFDLKGTNLEDAELNKWRRRFSNIIFNNYSNIFKDLSLLVFREKLKEMLNQELQSVRFLSVMINNKNKKQPQPIIVQYFDNNSGIVHRLLGYHHKEITPNTIILEYQNIRTKIVGFCGDSYSVEPGDYYKSLCLLTERNLENLPHNDGLFLKHLFTMLSDYLPCEDDIYMILQRLGDTFMSMADSGLAQQVKEKYTDYLETDCDILLSGFGGFVVENLEAIVTYLKPFKCIYRCLSSLQEIQTRFFLALLRELYVELNGILDFKINNAVVYYFELKKIKDVFTMYQEIIYKTPDANKLLLADLERLKASGRIKPGRDEDLFRAKLDKSIYELYARAIALTDPLLERLQHLNIFSWILFKDLKNLQSNVHGSYHCIKENPERCDVSCEELKFEVDRLNLLDGYCLEENFVRLDKIWMHILEKDQHLILVKSLVMFVFSLPSSFESMQLKSRELKCVDANEIECVKKMLRFNLDQVNELNFVERIGEEVEEKMAEVGRVVENNKIKMLVD